MEYDGKYWTLSSQRLSYMRDKTRDDRYFILSLFAIAKEMERSGRYSPLEQIQLAVGIPPEHYGMLRDKFAQYFKRGIIKFAYKDKPYTVMIDRVMVFPQAYAAVVPQSSLVVHTLRIFIIDVGGYTTDVLLLQNGKPDLQFCRSLETGIITMNNEIIRKVGALRANPAVFIGGGSILLRPFFEASRLVAKADFVESPNANAIGYEMLARKQISLRPTV